MVKIVVPVKEKILRAAERRSKSDDAGVAKFLGELIDLGFEHHFQQLLRRYENGEIGFGYFADELGLSVRDLYALLEERNLPTSNVRKEAIETTS